MTRLSYRQGKSEWLKDWFESRRVAKSGFRWLVL